ncbi:MAG: GerMN domain-containing protein [candidate division NC10 bacterium]|nr:GerMN domain-containing protein [candidate division NC10 bacterium]
MATPNPRILLGLLLFAVAIGVGGFLLGRIFAPRAPALHPSPIQDGSVVTPTTRVIRLFFAVPDADMLQEEERTIVREASSVEEAKRTVEELFKGPESDLNPTIPPGVQLRQIYIDGQGIAYVDFSRDLQRNHPGGSVGELLTIYSIVDTLSVNFDEIVKVKILVEGSEILTLAGHIDTRHPFNPRYSLERVR